MALTDDRVVGFLTSVLRTLRTQEPLATAIKLIPSTFGTLNVLPRSYAITKQGLTTVASSSVVLTNLKGQARKAQPLVLSNNALLRASLTQQDERLLLSVVFSVDLAGLEVVRYWAQVELSEQDLGIPPISRIVSQLRMSKRMERSRPSKLLFFLSKSR